MQSIKEFNRTSYYLLHYLNYGGSGCLFFGGKRTFQNPQYGTQPNTLFIGFAGRTRRSVL